MNSNIQHLGILTQYQAGSLMSHIGDGESWNFTHKNHSLTFLHSPHSNGFSGTADAVAQNIEYIKQFETKDVLILSGREEQNRANINRRRKMS
jgi:glucose-1-phosphate adenylyltransferase